MSLVFHEAHFLKTPNHKKNRKQILTDSNLRNPPLSPDKTIVDPSLFKNTAIRNRVLCVLIGPRYHTRIPDSSTTNCQQNKPSSTVLYFRLVNR